MSVKGCSLFVHREWQLVIPSVTYGMGHAILFPAGFAEGCCTFPPRYRGLGTSLMLATYDVGLLIGAPTAGLLVHFGQAQGWPGYPTMFVGVAIVLVLTTGVYATAQRPSQTPSQAASDRTASVCHRSRLAAADTQRAAVESRPVCRRPPIRGPPTESRREGWRRAAGQKKTARRAPVAIFVRESMTFGVSLWGQLYRTGGLDLKSAFGAAALPMSDHL